MGWHIDSAVSEAVGGNEGASGMTPGSLALGQDFTQKRSSSARLRSEELLNYARGMPTAAVSAARVSGILADGTHGPALWEGVDDTVDATIPVPPRACSFMAGL
eukprot:5587269-Amphidinium_carterae.1